MVNARCVAGAVQPTLKAVRAVSFGSTVTLRGFAPLTLQLFGTLPSARVWSPAWIPVAVTLSLMPMELRWLLSSVTV